jgi:hypothetical protein
MSRVKRRLTRTAMLRGVAGIAFRSVRFLRGNVRNFLRGNPCAVGGCIFNLNILGEFVSHDFMFLSRTGFLLNFLYFKYTIFIVIRNSKR